MSSNTADIQSNNVSFISNPQTDKVITFKVSLEMFEKIKEKLYDESVKRKKVVTISDYVREVVSKDLT